MAGIYSTRFWLGEITGTPETVYTVPEGYVAVLKCFSGNIGGAGIQNVYILVNGVYVLNWYANAGNPGDAGALDWQGMIVLNPGDTVGVQASVATYAQLSGYLLSA